MTALARTRSMTLAAAALVGLVGGAIAAVRPVEGLAVAAAILLVAGMVMLGDRAFPVAIVGVAVLPWYPFISTAAVPPLVPQRIFCAVIAAAVVVPWLWSLASGSSGHRPRPLPFLYGLLVLLMTVMIASSVGAIKPMIESGTFGLIFGGLAFLVARRFVRTPGWETVGFGAVVILLVLGLLAFAADPSNRIGYFTGYPITYGALIMGTLPLAISFALRRSPVLAGGLAVSATAALILSESRSSWIAIAGVVLIVVVLLMRLGRWRALGTLAVVLTIVGAALAQTDALKGVVERKLSADVRMSDSVTHRAWSYGYAAEQIKQRPVFGAGYPGYSAQQAAQETDIGAVDNGYLSSWVDLGLVGLLAVTAPIAVAVGRLGRWLWMGTSPPGEDLALVLGIVGVALVTIFYDSFYWAQLALLLGAMGGVLSRRPAGALAQRGVRIVFR